MLGEMNRRRADPGMLVFVGTRSCLQDRAQARRKVASSVCSLPPDPSLTPPGHTGGCRGPRAEPVLSCPGPLLVRPVLGKPPFPSTGPTLQAHLPGCLLHPCSRQICCVPFVPPAAGLRATGGSSKYIGKTGSHWASPPVQLNLRLWSQISLGFLSTPVRRGRPQPCRSHEG